MSGKFLMRCLIGCIAAMFSLPFVWPTHTLPIPSFYGECIAAALVLLACMAAAALSCLRRNDDGRNCSLPVILFLFVPLIGVLGIQALMGTLPFFHSALLPVLVMVCAMAATALGATAARTLGLEKLLFWIGVALVGGGVFNVIAQALQFFGTGSYSLMWVSHAKSSYYGNMAQRNHLATYLSWSLIAVFYLHAKTHLHKPVTVALVIFLLIGIALTASRMTWLQVSWIALGGGYLMWKMKSPQRPRFWQLIFFLPLIYLIVTLALPHILNLWDMSLGETALERIRTDALDANRWLIYSQAWEIFKNNPVWGIGPGELSFHQFLLMDHYDKILFATSAHNLVLDLLVTTGIVGLLFFVWALAAWFLRIRKTAMSLETACVWLMLAVFGIHSLLEFPEWYGFFLFTVAFFLGCVETRFIQLKSATALQGFVIGSLMCGLAISAVLCMQYKKLETLYADSYYFNRKALPASEKKLKELEAYQASSLFKAPAEFLVSWNIRLDKTNLDKKLAMSERAMRYQPGANVIYRHIVWLAFAGRQDEAAFYLVRLRKTFPTEFVSIYNVLSRMAAKQPEIFGNLLSMNDKNAAAARK